MGTLPLTCPCCSTKEVWAHLSHTKGKLSFLSFLPPQAVAVHSPHEAKPFRIMLFLFVCGAARVCAPGQTYVCVYIYGREMCVILYMCARGRLWHASLVWSLHQEKSIPLYSAACSACLYWVEIGWTSFMLHAFACCMNTICWRPVGTLSICIVSAFLCEGKQFAAIVWFVMRICVHER